MEWRGAAFPGCSLKDVLSRMFFIVSRLPLSRYDKEHPLITPAQIT